MANTGPIPAKLPPNRLETHPEQFTPAQRKLLSEMARMGTRVRVVDLAERLGQHPNSIRELLDALVRAGAVRVSKIPSKKAGRPAYYYEVSALPDLRVYVHELSAMNSNMIYELSRLPQAKTLAQSIGENTIIQLLAQYDVMTMTQYATYMKDQNNKNTSPSSSHKAFLTREDLFSRLRVMLSEMGCSPEQEKDSSTIQLRTCPFLMSDSTSQRFMCDIHKTMISVLVDRISEGENSAHLHPFSGERLCSVDVH